MLSLRETARRHDIDAGYLSARVHAGKPAKGYELHQYARFSAEGRIEGFHFPQDYDFPSSGSLKGADSKETGSKETGSKRASSKGADAKDAPRTRHAWGDQAWGERPDREDLINAALAEADDLALPDRADWITEEEVTNLLAEHLPVTGELGQIVYALQCLERDGYYRKDQIMRFIRLVAHYGARKAVKRVRQAYATGVALERGEEDALDHDWLSHDEAYAMLDQCCAEGEVSAVQIEGSMYTLLRPIEVGPPAMAYFRRDRVNDFISKIARLGFEKAVYALEEDLDYP